MPVLTRWFIKSSLIYFVAALLISLTLAASTVWDLPDWTVRLGPAYFHLFLVGWVTQLIIGVVYWILPRFSGSRGNTTLAWLAFGLLNLGVWLAGVGPAVGAPAIVTFLGRLAEVGAALAFAIHAWPRIKPVGT
jgi:hypothetical protein